MTLLCTCCFNRFRSFVLYTILVNKYMFYYYVIFECVNIMTNGFICCMWKCNFNEKCWEHRLYIYLTATQITYISSRFDLRHNILLLFIFACLLVLRSFFFFLTLIFFYIFCVSARPAKPAFIDSCLLIIFLIIFHVSAHPVTYF